MQFHLQYLKTKGSHKFKASVTNLYKWLMGWSKTCWSEAFAYFSGSFLS